MASLDSPLRFSFVDIVLLRFAMHFCVSSIRPTLQHSFSSLFLPFVFPFPPFLLFPTL